MMRWILVSIGFVVAAALVIWAAQAKLSDFNRERTRQAELSAVNSLKYVQTAQVQYLSMHGKYAAALKDLGPAPGADLIPAKLAAGSAGGYRFTMTGDAKKFAITAQPEASSAQESRSYFLDETGILRESRSKEVANASSPEAR